MKENWFSDWLDIDVVEKKEKKKEKKMKTIMVIVYLTPVSPILTVPVCYSIYKFTSWIKSIILT